ncbi:unnamed protein product [Ostreobium quekettii]|uniref:60S ribosomal protein L6 n=1 Tax=Ostreobium quekettii TaxID=121088 RepID=A0A8S1IMA8_9CHLO|nr:unnamed protein product [Ostreobium quekettii]|eukprot:evm.model.scf_51.6 EVM.evm.TU.scf_51.6   scf_51:54071-54658(-)
MDGGGGPAGVSATGKGATKRQWYPTEHEAAPPKARRRYTQRALRPSITPGTVLILLAGKHKGRRVVFLKQLQPSGMLLVTGPFRVNGVPARRVHPRLVIATSTKVDLGGVALDVFTDEYFRAVKPDAKKKKKKRSQEDFFEVADEEEKKEFKPEYYENNKKLDAQIVPKLDAEMKGYLKSTFTLKSGDRPHLMKF